MIAFMHTHERTYVTTIWVYCEKEGKEWKGKRNHKRDTVNNFKRECATIKILAGTHNCVNWIALCDI